MSRSPNFGPRRDGLRPELVVLHYTAMESCDAAERVLCDPACEVSAHYLISEAGDVRQLVDEDLRAWHAGAGEWGGQGDVNSRSIGIELSNTGFTPFAAPQIDALEGLLEGILMRWSIPPEGVIAHSDMAPGRKIDPGPRFDWLRLARRGLSVWPWGASLETVPDARRFRALARAFGYPDVEDALLLDTVRLRFRPRHDGPLDRIDMAIMSELADRFAVDRRAANP